MIQNWGLVGTVVIVLGAITFFGQWLRRQSSSRLDRRSIEAFNARVQAWWFFGAVMVLGFCRRG